jgi:hypothetical protein
MFSGIKKAMAESREAEEARRNAERAAVDRIFSYRPGSDRWEYCFLSHVKAPGPKEEEYLSIQFVNPNGKVMSTNLYEGSGQDHPEPLEIVAALGQAGWEIYTEEHDVTLVDEDNVDLNPKHFSKNLLTTNTYRFKRRIIQSGQHAPRADDVI